MRTTVNITCVIDDDVSIETLTYLLETAGVGDINIETRPQYEDWLVSLRKEAIPGLNDACLDWIRCWGNGGGDQSSQTCISDAVKDLGSDVPAELADAIFNSVTGYSKSEFDAVGLTIELIENCMEECLAELREREINAEEEDE